MPIFIQNANLSFKNKPIFSDLNLEFKSGQWTCLLGGSGVGKTSLLRLMAGLNEVRQQPFTQSSATISAPEYPNLKGRVIYMAQQDGLLPWLSALDNVLHCKRLEGYDPLHYVETAKALLHQVGLQEFLDYYPANLSGGMRQRVALARTLMADKPIVLLDEPFSALDAITRYRLQNLAAKCLKGRTVIMVTHDPLEALRLGQEIKILAGSPAKLAEILSLETPSPRDLEDPKLIVMYKHILDLLKHYHPEQETEE
ncbi:MAG: nitrate/sulfonate/bicarbonate transporter ATP-binding protein [Gammaproteobacteria bacterium]|nr:nitrate/sulfonate/bicarbonate transporter ATP-binding protein [Gammaproteobacteria bacterium]